MSRGEGGREGRGGKGGKGRGGEERRFASLAAPPPCGSHMALLHASTYVCVSTERGEEGKGREGKGGEGRGGEGRGRERMCVTGWTSALWLSYGPSSCHYVYVCEY